MSARTPWINAIVRYGEEAPDQLLAFPGNPKIHPRSQQAALEGAIGELGWLSPVVCNEVTGHILDGHARIGLAISRGEERVPVVYVAIPAEKEALAVATIDPIGGLAAHDKDALDALLRDVATGDAALQTFLSEFVQEQGLAYGGDGLPRLEPKEPEEDYAQPDGIEELVGYSLSSLWHTLPRENEVRPYMLELPDNPGSGANTWLSVRYSRTNATETERIVKTYMRPGDRFFEMCCGWMTFSSTAKYFGYSGRGGDIWDVSLEFCARQLDAVPGKGAVDVVRADCRNTGEPDAAYDFVHSNPPFFSLEPYGDSGDDLASCGSYERWLGAMGEMAAEAHRLLRPGGLANFVINDYREDGALRAMHADFMAAVAGSGLVLHDLVVAEVMSQAIRFRKRDYERRRTVKCHEYVLTFRKLGGDGRAS